MRRLILSSTLDFLAFLLGLLSFAAGRGPLLTVVLLRSDDCITVEVESDSAGPKLVDENALHGLASASSLHNVSTFSFFPIAFSSSRHQTSSAGWTHT